MPQANATGPVADWQWLWQASWISRQHDNAVAISVISCVLQWYRHLLQTKSREQYWSQIVIVHCTASSFWVTQGNLSYSAKIEPIAIYINDVQLSGNWKSDTRTRTSAWQPKVISEVSLIVPLWLLDDSGGGTQSVNVAKVSRPQAKPIGHITKDLQIPKIFSWTAWERHTKPNSAQLRDLTTAPKWAANSCQATALRAGWDWV